MSHVLFNRALDSLDLSGNKLNLGGCKVICGMMKSNGTIKHLALANNNFQVESLQAIAGMLQVNRALTKIVWGEGTKIFTMDTSTEAIDFSGKGLAAHDAQIVASMLPKCT